MPFTVCRKWPLHFTVIKHSYFLNANPGRLINIKHRNLNPQQHVQAAGAAKAQPRFSHILSDSLGHHMRKHILIIKNLISCRREVLSDLTNGVPGLLLSEYPLYDGL